ncbi:MAG: PQQ-dependent sugar dehydrogenase [Bacteroidia bacterium]
MKREITHRCLLLLVSCIAIIFNCSIGKAQPVITLNNFSGPYSSPLGIFNCGDNRLFVMERSGYIYICDLNGVKNTTPFLDIHARVTQNAGEQGLLGMDFHPNYATNGYIYVNYINLSGNTIVSRFTRSASNINRMDETTEFILMTITQPYSNHNGGCIHFGKDGYLYIAQGDGGSAGDPGGRAQNNLERLGKFLRIDVNSGNPYSIPPSNPNYGSTSALQEIWAKGVRNPWRWSFDSYTGDMWIGDVGQDIYEEIDYQPAGSIGGINYGWRCYEGNHVYNTSSNCPAASALTFPVFEYTHGSLTGCSVTGGYVYRGGLNGELFGKYIFADYCSGKMRMIEKTGTSTFIETDLSDQPNNEISSFGEDVNEELYVCYISSGSIKKLSSAGCSPTAFIKGNSTINTCGGTPYNLQAIYGAGLTYQWFKNNVLISGAISANYPVTNGGNYTVVVNKTGGCTATSNSVKVIFSPISKITAGGPITFCAGGSVTFNATIGTGFGYQWKRNNIAIGGATGANYTATQPGNYKVQITNANGCIKNSNVITVTINCKLAEQWQNEQLNIDVIPNPASDLVSINVQGLPNHQYVAMMYDMVGKKINEWKVITNDESVASHTIDVSSLNKGIYNLIIIGENGNEYKKLVVQ